MQNEKSEVQNCRKSNSFKGVISSASEKSDVIKDSPSLMLLRMTKRNLESCLL